MYGFLRSVTAVYLLLITFSFSASSQSLDSLQEARQEYYFRLDTLQTKQIALLSKMISIDKVYEDYLIAYANPNQYQALLAAGFRPVLLNPPGLLADEPLMMGADEIRIGGSWDYYPTYEAYEELMYAFESNYPDLCSIHTIGILNSGRKLLAARINNGNPEGKAEFLYTGTIHGDETTGYILLLRLIEHLLMNYGTDSQITQLVNGLDIWINPLSNPNGTYWGGNHTVNGSRRGNANNIDLNRNYPDPEDGPNPDGNAWQEETIFFMDFAEERSFIMSANTHGGVEVINYPYDTWSRRHADNDWWIMVSREYADTAQYYSPPGYMTYLDNGITNGYDWYSISGGRQDFMNYFHYCREVTMEISNIKTLPPAQLPAYWGYNYRSLLNYMQQSTFGFHGTITDAVSGAPIRAKVELLNHELDNSFVYSFLPAGNYHRLVKAGTYTLVFTAEGYHPLTISNVKIADGERKEIDIQLIPGTIIADFTASEYDISKGGQVSFFDASYGQNIISWEWHFEGGIPEISSQQNPANIVYPQTGEFDVSLIITSSSGESDTLTKENVIRVSSYYVMTNGIFFTCEGTFLDPGGKDANYGNNQDFITTFYPNSEDSAIRVNFTMFDIEANINCNWDWLKIYDGPNTLSPLLGTWCGTDSPGTIIAENSYGALTFQFHSDISVTRPGWEAELSCVSTVGISNNMVEKVTLFPNPDRQGTTYIQASKRIKTVTVYDLSGRLMYKSEELDQTDIAVPTSALPEGIYFIRLDYQDSSSVHKLIR